jgi:excisionase family DNA binding protein
MSFNPDNNAVQPLIGIEQDFSKPAYLVGDNMTTKSRPSKTLLIDAIGELITVRDAAQVLSVHGNTIRRWNDRGIIKAYRIGNRGDRRFSLKDIYKLQTIMNLNSGNIKIDR